MQTMIMQDTSIKAWEQYVLKHPGSIAWQSFEWSSVLKKHYPITFMPISVVCGTDIRGILPLYRIGSSPGKNVLISVPYAVAGGILADDDEAESMLVTELFARAKEYQSQGIALKQYKKKIAGDFRTDDGFYNKELDISRDLDVVWKGLDERNKKFIEEVRGNLLALEYPSVDISSFYKLLLHHHHLKGVPCVSRKWIEDLINFKLYTVALLKLNGRPVAGTLVKEFKDTVSFPFSCIAHDDERHRMFAYSLYWRLISRFAARGTRIYHSGRIPRSNDVEEYRLGWGGTPYDYHYQYYPGNEQIRPESNKKGRKRKLFEAVWRRMPEKIVSQLGPAIVKRFP